MQPSEVRTQAALDELGKLLKADDLHSDILKNTHKLLKGKQAVQVALDSLNRYVHILAGHSLSDLQTLEDLNYKAGLN